MTASMRRYGYACYLGGIILACVLCCIIINNAQTTSAQQLIAYYPFTPSSSPLSPLGTGFCPPRLSGEEGDATANTNGAVDGNSANCPKSSQWTPASSNNCFKLTAASTGASKTLIYGNYLIDSFDKSFSFSLWAKFVTGSVPSSGSTSDYYVLIGKESSETDFAWSVRVYKSTSSTVKLSFLANIGGTRSTPLTDDIVLNTWFHVAGVYDNQNIILYINGVQKTAAPASGNPVESTSQPIHTDVAGWVDEVKIFARNISSTEVSNEFGRSSVNPIPAATIDFTDAPTVLTDIPLSLSGKSNVVGQEWAVISQTAACDAAVVANPTQESTTVRFKAIGDFIVQVILRETDLCTIVPYGSGDGTVTVEGIHPNATDFSQLPNSVLLGYNKTKTLQIQVSGFPVPSVVWQVRMDFPNNSAFLSRREQFESWQQRRRSEHGYAERIAAEFPICETATPENDCSFFVAIPGATGLSYDVFPGSPDLNGTEIRVSVTNYLGSAYSDPITLFAAAGVISGDGTGDGTGDGGGTGSGDGSSGDGDNKDVLIPAIVGSIGGVIFACCCCLLLLIFLALLILAGRKRRHGHRSGFPGVPPDYDNVIYNQYLEPMYRVKSKQARDLAKLERLLVDDRSFGLAKAIAYTKGIQDENVPRSLVYIFHANTLDIPLLKGFISQEIAEIDPASGTMFRSNTVTPRLFKHFALIFASQYLWETIGEFVWEVQDNARQVEEVKEEDEEMGAAPAGKKHSSQRAKIDLGVEIDPTKMDEAADPKINTLQLWLTAQKIFSSITRSANDMPAELREILCFVHDEVAEWVPGEQYKAIGAFLFLRLFCPGLLAPTYFGLLEEAPLPTAQRQLILVAKVLQNLANDTLPGQKEAFMVKLNEFITNNQDELRDFFRRIIDAKNLSMVDREIPETAKENALACIYNTLVNDRRNIEQRLHELVEADDPIFQKLDELLAKASPIPDN